LQGVPITSISIEKDTRDTTTLFQQNALKGGAESGLPTHLGSTSAHCRLMYFMEQIKMEYEAADRMNSSLKFEVNQLRTIKSSLEIQLDAERQLRHMECLAKHVAEAEVSRLQAECDRLRSQVVVPGHRSQSGSSIPPPFHDHPAVETPPATAAASSVVLSSADHRILEAATGEGQNTPPRPPRPLGGIGEEVERGHMLLGYSSINFEVNAMATTATTVSHVGMETRSSSEEFLSLPMMMVNSLSDHAGNTAGTLMAPTSAIMSPALGSSITCSNSAPMQVFIQNNSSISSGGAGGSLSKEVFPVYPSAPQQLDGGGKQTLDMYSNPVAAKLLEGATGEAHNFVQVGHQMAIDTHGPVFDRKLNGSSSSVRYMTDDIAQPRQPPQPQASSFDNPFL